MEVLSLIFMAGDLISNAYHRPAADSCPRPYVMPCRSHFRLQLPFIPNKLLSICLYMLQISPYSYYWKLPTHCFWRSKALSHGTRIITTEVRNPGEVKWGFFIIAVFKNTKTWRMGEVKRQGLKIYGDWKTDAEKKLKTPSNRKLCTGTKLPQMNSSFETNLTP